MGLLSHLPETPALLIFVESSMNFLKLRYDPDIGLLCAAMKTASGLTIQQT